MPKWSKYLEDEKNNKFVNPNKPPKIKPEVKAKLEGENPEQYIPNGMYCYGDDLTDLCPFWDWNRNQPEQFYGYCHFLKLGDWMDLEEGATSLLWDRCKECGIKDELNEEDVETIGSCDTKSQ